MRGIFMHYRVRVDRRRAVHVFVFKGSLFALLIVRYDNWKWQWSNPLDKSKSPKFLTSKTRTSTTGQPWGYQWKKHRKITHHWHWRRPAFCSPLALALAPYRPCRAVGVDRQMVPDCVDGSRRVLTARSWSEEVEPMRPQLWNYHRKGPRPNGGERCGHRRGWTGGWAAGSNCWCHSKATAREQRLRQAVAALVGA